MQDSLIWWLGLPGPAVGGRAFSSIEMDSYDIISLEDEVQEFLLTWNSGSQEDVGSPKKVIGTKVDTTGKNNSVVDEEAVEGGGSTSVPANTRWTNNNVYSKVHEVHDGGFPSAPNSNTSRSKISMGAPLESDRRGVKRCPTSTMSPVDPRPKSYIEELKARWPSKYKKLRKDMEDARENK